MFMRESRYAPVITGCTCLSYHLKSIHYISGKIIQRQLKNLQGASKDSKNRVENEPPPKYTNWVSAVPGCDNFTVERDLYLIIKQTRAHNITVPIWPILWFSIILIYTIVSCVNYQCVPSTDKIGSADSWYDLNNFFNKISLILFHE